jgi:hypothetical protein
MFVSFSLCPHDVQHWEQASADTVNQVAKPSLVPGSPLLVAYCRHWPALPAPLLDLPLAPAS